MDDNFSNCYNVPAALHIPTGLILLGIYKFGILEDLQNQKRRRMSLAEIELEQQKPRKLALFVFLFTLFIFYANTVQQTFNSFLHQYSRCSSMNITSETSAHNMIAYWTSNTFGRFILATLGMDIFGCFEIIFKSMKISTVVF